jgi:hypothetical protein
MQRVGAAAGHLGRSLMPRGPHRRGDRGGVRTHLFVNCDPPGYRAGAVCDDIGAPYEFAPTNGGMATLRRSVVGAHMCLVAGLPHKVAQFAAGHSFEGRCTGVSAACMSVRQADDGWWHVAGALGLIAPESVGVVSGSLRARAALTAE